MFHTPPSLPRTPRGNPHLPSPLGFVAPFRGKLLDRCQPVSSATKQLLVLRYPPFCVCAAACSCYRSLLAQRAGLQTLHVRHGIHVHLITTWLGNVKVLSTGTSSEESTAGCH